VVDHVRQELLLAMYASVERMNDHMLRNETDSVLSEEALQVNLRSNFEELQREE
jgi:hypothetical protein